MDGEKTIFLGNLFTRFWFLLAVVLWRGMFLILMCLESTLHLLHWGCFSHLDHFALLRNRRFVPNQLHISQSGHLVFTMHHCEVGQRTHPHRAFFMLITASCVFVLCVVGHRHGNNSKMTIHKDMRPYFPHSQAVFCWQSVVFSLETNCFRARPLLLGDLGSVLLFHITEKISVPMCTNVLRKRGNTPLFWNNVSHRSSYESILTCW